MEVADQYPLVNVVGFDLAPIQPTYIPLNCEFQVADLTQDLADLNTMIKNIDSFMLDNGNHISTKCFEFSNLALGGLSLLRQRGPMFANGIDPADSVIPSVSIFLFSGAYL